MKEITSVEYSEAFKNADSKTQALMSSEKLYEVINNNLLLTKSNIDPLTLVLPIGYHLLNLLSLEEILLELTNLGVSDQFNFLSSVKAALKDHEGDIQTETTKDDTALPPLEDVRTMTSDQRLNSQQTESTYPSQQDAILTKIDTVSPTNPPRWGSEN